MRDERLRAGRLAARATVVLLLAAPLGAGTAARAAFPAANGKIAFVGQRDGNADIYVMNADGTAQTRLTNDAAADVDPVFSPDGAKIAFASRRAGNYDIYVMNADGSGQTRLTSARASDRYPAWSPSGSQIAFRSFRTGNGDLYVMNADGTAQTRLTFTPRVTETQPTWSPTGGRLAFASVRDGNWDIYAMNPDGSAVTRLTTDPAFDRYPRWSPDGERIAFATRRDANWEVYAMHGDGSGATDVSNDAAADDRFPAWSPDGTGIALRKFRGASSDIFTMAADGSGQTRLSSPGPDSEPDWQAASYSWAGFFEPVDNGPTVNVAQAGSAIPVKFSLGGSKGLAIFASGYPSSQPVNCDTHAPTDVIEETAAAGATSLTYDGGTDRYTYVWKTDAAWAGTCRQLVLHLADGTYQRANFHFRTKK